MKSVNDHLSNLAMLREDLDSLLVEELRKEPPQSRDGFQGKEPRSAVVGKIARARSQLADLMASVGDAFSSSKRG